MSDFPLFAYVRSQLPQHIQDEYETFQLFIEAYYEFMQQQTQALGVVDQLQTYRDPHLTIDQFVESLLEEMAFGIPNDALVDKRLFIQHVMDLFKAKGSEKAAKLLFYILYNERITVDYPAERILIASDGRWVTDLQLACSLISGNLENVGSDYIVGDTSGALAGIETFTIQKVPGFELNGSNDVVYFTLNDASLSGTFIEDELIYIFKGQPNEVVLRSLKVLSDIEVISGGAGYEIGDFVNVSGVSGGPAKGIVTYVTSGKLINPAGTSIQNNSNVVEITTGNIFHNLTSTSKVYLEFEKGIASGNYSVNTIISPTKFTVLATSIDQVDGAVSIQDVTFAGAIERIDILETGANLVAPYTFDIDSSVGAGASLSIAFGPTIKWAGEWRGERGKISEGSIVLQDNRKFQSFSYVIRTSESINKWRDVVKDTIHPAGMYLGGQIVIQLKVDGFEEPETLVQYIIKAQVSKDIFSTIKSGIQYLIRHDTGAKVNPNTFFEWLERWKFTFDSPGLDQIEDLRDKLYIGFQELEPSYLIEDTGKNYNGTQNEGYWIHPRGEFSSYGIFSSFDPLGELQNQVIVSGSACEDLLVYLVKDESSGGTDLKFYKKNGDLWELVKKVEDLPDVSDFNDKALAMDRYGRVILVKTKDIVYIYKFDENTQTWNSIPKPFPDTPFHQFAVSENGNVFVHYSENSLSIFRNKSNSWGTELNLYSLLGISFVIQSAAITGEGKTLFVTSIDNEVFLIDLIDITITKLETVLGKEDIIVSSSGDILVTADSINQKITIYKKGLSENFWNEEYSITDESFQTFDRMMMNSSGNSIIVHFNRGPSAERFVLISKQIDGSWGHYDFWEEQNPGNLPMAPRLIKVIGNRIYIANMSLDEPQGYFSPLEFEQFGTISSMPVGSQIVSGGTGEAPLLLNYATIMYYNWNDNSAGTEPSNTPVNIFDNLSFPNAGQFYNLVQVDVFGTTGSTSVAEAPIVAGSAHIFNTQSLFKSVNITVETNVKVLQKVY